MAEETLSDLLVAPGTMSSTVDDAADLAISPIGFVELELGLSLYPWQDDALAPLEDLIDDAGRIRRVEVSLVAPNGSGKSERVVAGAVLYWLAVHPRGRVIVTSKDSKQIHEQVWPALHRHRPKFGPTWHWVTSPYCKITTPTGGTAILYTTNDEGRAEGAHMDFNPWEGNFDGPLLIIVDEAKSVDEGIFEALDRCGYNVRMLVSSPGVKEGTFYESQTKFRNNPYICIQAGLVDCPHIPQSKIDSILQKYGQNDPFTRSTLFGEFMDATMRQRFQREALEHVKEMAHLATAKARDGRLDPQPGGKKITLVPAIGLDPTAWLRWWELPIPGCRYLVVLDTATSAEQQRGAKNPDRHSALVLRDAYTDQFGIIHHPAVTARIIPPCHAMHEILAERVAFMSRWLGNAIVVVEYNMPGPALIALLRTFDVPLYSRREGSADNPILKPGFSTNMATRPEIIAKLATRLREQSLDIWCPHISQELGWFAIGPDGKEAAEPGLHDDDVMALAIGAHCLPSAVLYREQAYRSSDWRGERVSATS